MSCYNWESGAIKIPAKEWSKFRTALIKKHNELELARFETAKKIHAKAVEKAKGKRGVNRQAILRQYRDQVEDTAPRMMDQVFKVTRDKGQLHIELLPVPKKKDFKILPTTKDATLPVGWDGEIRLINKDKTVCWKVFENNRAVEDARAHTMGKLFFRLLDSITWTRGSGGKIVGNDEYNRDADYEGGGGNYVTAEYGVEAQKRKRKAEAYYRSSVLGGSFYSRRW